MFQNAKMDFIEHSPVKLLLNMKKSKSLLDVTNKKITFDPSFPISIELHLTNRCNLDCKWCIDRGIRNNRCDIPYDTLIRFLNDVIDTNIGITLEGGGEPTIYPFFEDFVLEAAKRKVPLGLISNGVNAFSPALVKRFQWIRISIDAGVPEEYFTMKGADQFENVLHNLGEICKHKVDTLIGVGYVLSMENYKYIPSLLWKIQDMGVDYIQIRVVEENNKLKVTKKILSEVKNDIKYNFCPSTLRVMLNNRLVSNHSNNDNLPCIAHSLRSIVHADGLVYLCEKRRHDPIILGSIVESSFIDIWNSQIRREASQKLLNPNNQNGCAVCRITEFNHLFLDLDKIKTKNFI